jgi:hypothetical protein
LSALEGTERLVLVKVIALFQALNFFVPAIPQTQVAVNTMKGTAILGSDCGHIFKNYETEIPSCFIVDLVAG